MTVTDCRFADLALAGEAMVVRSLPTPSGACPDCQEEPRRPRRGQKALKFPGDYLRFEPVDALLSRHPWMENSRLAALPVALRDAVVSNA